MKRFVAETQTLNWSQVGLQEYLLVAYTDELVNSKVLAEKERFSNRYKHKIDLQTKSHITIASFLAREAMEETIFRYMQRTLMQQQSFEVALNNFSGLPTHTIYLRVQNQQPFKQLTNELKVVSNYIDSCSCPPVRFPNNSHVDLATNLPETLYLTAMMDYSQKSFYETFVVNELVLLRRSHQYETCKPVQIFGLPPSQHKAFKNTLYN